MPFPHASEVVAARFELPVTLSGTGATATAQLPKEFRIFPSGNVATTKGNFQFDADSAKSVMARAAQWGNKFSIDYEHGAVQRNGNGPAPAAGWYQLELRAGELWATEVEWTKTAASLLAEKAYRYFSPAFTHAKNRILELINLGLTNLPATKGMQPLVASLSQAEEESPKMKALLSLLGLAEDASETSAIEALKKATATQRIIQQLTETPDDAAAIAVIEEWKRKGKKYKKLKKKLRKAKVKAQGERLGEVIKAAIKDGKLPPSQKEWAETLGAKDPDALVTFLKNAPVIPLKYREATEMPGAAGKDGKRKLTKKEKKFARLAGISDDAFLESMTRNEAAKEAAEEAEGDDEDEREEEQLQAAIAKMAKDDPAAYLGKSAVTAADGKPADPKA